MRNVRVKLAQIDHDCSTFAKREVAVLQDRYFSDRIHLKVLLAPLLPCKYVDINKRARYFADIDKRFHSPARLAGQSPVQSQPAHAKSKLIIANDHHVKQILIGINNNIQMRNQNERNQAENARNEQQVSQQQEYDTFLYKFQQQIIDAWKPVPHTSSNVVLYVILSAICIGLGLGLILSAPTSEEVYVDYSDCLNGTVCNKTFTLNATLAAPVYFYYGLTGFYQNHRRYLKYYSSSQLSSGTIDVSTISADCGDYVTNQQTFGTNAVSRVSGQPLNNSANAFPCGTIARFYYKLYPEIKGFSIKYANGSTVPMTQSGIAWPSDIGRHKNPSSTSQIGFDVNDETWLVWFRPAARSSFYKLNGIINSDLPAGTYTVSTTVNVSPTFGTKSFSLSKSNFVGNRDLFLGIAFLALGGGCVILLIIFLAKWIAEKRDRQKFD